MLDFVSAVVCGALLNCADQPCRPFRYEGVNHTICSFDSREVQVRTLLRDEKGRAYGRLSAAAQAFDTEPLMLMNGGMYHEDLSAVGLYVEESKKLKSLSTRDGRGNFHLLPNGVFWVRGKTVGVTETKAFARSGKSVDYATQSGPMLVIDGELHPRFLPKSDSLKIRNGVGVSKDGKRLHFAISHQLINFWTFGRLFQKELKTPNALFLDGTVSVIRSSQQSTFGWRAIGPIIGVYPATETAK